MEERSNLTTVLKRLRDLFSSLSPPPNMTRFPSPKKDTSLYVSAWLRLSDTTEVQLIVRQSTASEPRPNGGNGSTDSAKESN